MKEYEGGYDDYLRQRPAEPAAESQIGAGVDAKKSREAAREPVGS